MVSDRWPSRVCMDVRVGVMGSSVKSVIVEAVPFIDGMA